MAKSPRKSASNPRPAKVPFRTEKKVGGKRVGSYAYKDLGPAPQRRFSIIDSSSDEPHFNDSDDSESSLTAVSDEDVQKFARNSGAKTAGKSSQSYGRKSTVYGRKRTPKKTVWKSEEAVSDSDDGDASSDDSEDSDSGSSSSDSDIDFVKAQAQRKVTSMKAARAMKGLSKQHKQRDEDSSSDESVFESEPEVDISDLVALTKPKGSKTVSRPKASKRKASVSRPFGRRKSEAVLPEDINFKFEFDDKPESDDEQPADHAQDQESANEDIGEELSPEAQDGLSATTPLDFEFDSLIQVPKIKEDELNSDDDYEIDDNELLATLQADNGMDEFLDQKEADIRHNSIGSIEDDDNDPFLKEEEKFLVNEFENNGFDDEGIDIEDYDASETSRNSILDSFNLNNDQKQVIQYESDSEEDDDEDDEEGDVYDDFIDFNEPIYESIGATKTGKTKKSKRKSSLGSDDDDDSYLWNYFFSSDGSSGEEEWTTGKKNIEGDNSDSGEKRLDLHHRKPYMEESLIENDYDSGESTDVDLSLPKSSNKSKLGSKMAKEVLSSKTADYRPPVLGTWVAIDSKPFGIIDGLSTRSLNSKQLEPRSKPKKLPAVSSVGNNGAGTTSDSALGLDELLNISELDDDDENDVRIWRDFNNQKNPVPLGAFRNKSVLQNSIIHPENVTSHYNHTSKSNNDFNKRRYSLTNHGPTSNAAAANPAPKRNSVSKPKKPRRNSATLSYGSGTNKKETSKLKRRKASIVEAVSEGFRPTKSGLFSEHALADVEEVLGDDNELMALIKGL